jgi:hypothetical protein
MGILRDFDGYKDGTEISPKMLIFSGNMGGASERDRTSDLLITNQLLVSPSGGCPANL